MKGKQSRFVCQRGLSFVQKKWSTEKLKDSPKLTKNANEYMRIYGNGVRNRNLLLPSI